MLFRISSISDTVSIGLVWEIAIKWTTRPRFFVFRVDRYSLVSAPQNQKTGCGTALIALEVGFQAFLSLKTPNFRPFGSRNGLETAGRTAEFWPRSQPALLLEVITIVGSCIAVGPGIVEMCVLLLFESGWSHPDIGPGTKGVQSYMYNKYTVYCYLYTRYNIQSAAYSSPTKYLVLECTHGIRG